MTRSRHADKFNHDEDAADYDVDVTREHHPIRAGYADVLDRVASVVRGGRVLDIGSGTGNLSVRLPEWAHLTAVDVSEEMTAIAREKLAGRDPVDFVKADALEFFDVPRGPFDAIVSTYAIHHLTDDEKTAFFAGVARSLASDGVAAFGDLMFADDDARARFVAECDDRNLVEDIDDEFFWNVDRARSELRALGFDVDTQQVSALSWVVVARPA